MLFSPCYIGVPCMHMLDFWLNTWIHIFVSMQVEVKPYVLDDQMCDECHGSHCNGRYAPYFCGNIHCLRYYCEHCWATIHSAPGTQNHRCFIKENGGRPRAIKILLNFTLSMFCYCHNYNLHGQLDLFLFVYYDEQNCVLKLLYLWLFNSSSHINVLFVEF